MEIEIPREPEAAPFPLAPRPAAEDPDGEFPPAWRDGASNDFKIGRSIASVCFATGTEGVGSRGARGCISLRGVGSADRRAGSAGRAAGASGRAGDPSTLRWTGASVLDLEPAGGRAPLIV